MKRFSHSNPCPICGGWHGKRRGQGERCYGFLSDDGWAHCTREEFAGGIRMNTASSTYAHTLHGECKCGARHDGDTRFSSATSQREIDVTYDYKAANGALLFQVVRWKPKGFSQRRPDGQLGWIWNLREVEPVLYHLPELLVADPKEPVFVAEGEKDADNLAGLGLVATTNPMGAGKWRAEYSETLRDRDVALLPDADQAGQDHMHVVARSLKGIARSIRIIQLPNSSPKSDVSDWLAAGGTVNGLKKLVLEAEEYPDASSITLAGSQHLHSSELVPTPHYHLTDLGNAQRFVARHGRDLRFCVEWNKWLVWDGRRWMVDTTGEVERRAKETALTIYERAAAEENEERRKALVKWATASESRGRLAAIVELAKTELGIPVSAEALDADPFLLNCR